MRREAPPLNFVYACSNFDEFHGGVGAGQPGTGENTQEGSRIVHVRPGRQITFRLTAPSLVLTILLLGVVAWSFLYQVSSSRTETLHSYSRFVGHLVSSHLRDAMQRKDRPSIDRQISRIGELEPVIAVRIVNKAGTIVHSTDPGDSGREFTITSPTCRACHLPDQAVLTTGQSVPMVSGSGRPVVRTVQLVTVESDCKQCHSKPIGAPLGVVMTDLDALTLGGAVRTRAEKVVWITGGLAILMFLVLLVRVRQVVVARVPGLEGMLSQLRSGARSMSMTGESSDEIDGLARSLQVFALDLDEQLALNKSVAGLLPVLERHPSPVLVLDQTGSILITNQHAATRLDPGGAKRLEGRPRSSLPSEPGEMMSEATVTGWCLGPDNADGQVVIALPDCHGQVIGFVEAWFRDPDAGEGTSGESTSGESTFGESTSGEVTSDEVTSDEVDPDEIRAPQGARKGARTDEWQLYATAFLSRVQPRAKAWRGVIGFDRRLALARRLVGDLSSAVDAARHPEEVDLCTLGQLALHEIQLEGPALEWGDLLDPAISIVGVRFQLRLLMVRLLRAATRQAAGNGSVILFTQSRPSEGSVFVGAWASRPGGEALLDPPDGPPLTDAIARAHGGAVEVDPAFDIGSLADQRGRRLRCSPVGSLYVARVSKS